MTVISWYGMTICCHINKSNPKFDQSRCHTREKRRRTSSGHSAGGRPARSKSGICDFMFNLPRLFQIFQQNDSNKLRWHDYWLPYQENWSKIEPKTKSHESRTWTYFFGSSLMSSEKRKIENWRFRNFAISGSIYPNFINLFSKMTAISWDDMTIGRHICMDRYCDYRFFSFFSFPCFDKFRHRSWREKLQKCLS